MLGMHWADWLVIIIYLVAIVVIGTWAMRRVKSASSFFISDRKFGKVMMMFFTFGTGTHSDQAVGVAAKTHSAGASGIWYQWLWLFVTPFFWLIAPIFRRMRAVTTADFFQARFGRSVCVLFALFGMIQMSVNIGNILRGSSAMVTAVTGGALDPEIVIMAMTVIFVAYGVAGGLTAAIVTDFIQGLLTIVLSFLILPFALHAVGGMAGLREQVADPAMFQVFAEGQTSASGEQITLFYVLVISFNALVGWVAQPHNFGMAAAGRTEMEGRVGVMCGILFKRVCTIAWVLTGLCAVALYAGQEVDIDHVYGLMAHDILPAVGPGLVGLFIASMLAAVMSSCDAFMVASAGLFTENIYRPLIAPGREDRHYLRIGRIASAVVVLFGIIYSFWLENIVQGLEIFWKIAAMMGVAFWAGLFWRRATSAGAWAATLGSFGAWMFTGKISLFGHELWNFDARLAHRLPEFMLRSDGGLALHWQMIIYLVVGLIACVVVSLLTRRQPAEQLDPLYECLRTPIGPDEPETEPFQLPPGTQPAPRSVLIQHPDFEIPRPSFVGVIGFLAGWLAVAALLGVFYWILGLGA
ncbi:sodium:solute symporter family protein [Candidatus Sumerlaeota bacterium]|nr:sodium:solute symporter family protein [Candidatus Sumerlaeota bacterium]